jgi:drug/metabolite transporter (DMT)-like permease
VRARALLFAVLAAACWGTGTVLSKAAVAEFPPLTLLTLQLAVSVVLLGAALWRTGRSLAGVDRRLVLLGALNPGLAYALSLIGLTTITASASVLIWALEPILIVVLAAVVLAERPGWRVVVLSLGAFIGVAVAIGGNLDHAGWLGVGLSLAGVLCCVVYSVATRRWIEASPSTLAVVAGQDLVALAVVAVTLLGGAVAGAWPLVGSVTAGGAASAIASGALYYGAAYLLYLNALRVLPVSIAAIAFYLVPVFGIAAARLAGEALTATQWIGATATIAAVLAVGFVDIRRSTGVEPVVRA